MAYTTAEGRRELLEALAGAIDEIGAALASLGEAYEQLDEHTADRLEEALFRPVQGAYGRAKRLYAEFAERTGFPPRTFAQGSPGPPSRGAKALVEDATEAAAAADDMLAELQDSMLPVEVGDPALRAGLAEIRETLSGTRARARELTRTFGR
jgi:hypothetical protein